MKLLPIGIENFKELIDKNYYYVDKTNLIANIINEKVVLYTRPRRFGKTLNMSMLYYFFSIKEKDNAYLFDYLNISKNKDALKHQNKYPTIFISLKEMKNSTFDAQVSSFGDIIKNVILQNKELLESVYVDESDRVILQDFRFLKGTLNQLKYSLKTISRCLYNHYHQKVIILIDEYDVPLQSAYQNNYYDEMVEFLRNVFSSALKTNDALEKGILTGCLRISKESIFTGLNNFKTYSLLDEMNEEYFGFNEKEVKQLLEDYQLSSYMDEVKEWYDGYQFGKEEIYCPWDVLNYIREHIGDRNVPPKLYWINTSGNEIVKKLIRRADSGMKDEIEQLIEGKSITKEIHMEMTYKDLDDPREGEADTKKENLWSILYTTGYLTSKTPSSDGRHYNLEIPNKEIRAIFVMQVREWMSETVIYGNTDRLLNFCQAVKIGEVDKFQELFNEYLVETISIRDTGAPSNRKESFYHGLLLGLLRGQGKWKVRSNLESGTGYADIVVEIPQEKTGLVIEVKYAENGSLDSACKRAVEQIEKKQYETQLEQDGMETIYKYGIACYKKKCRVLRG